MVVKYLRKLFCKEHYMLSFNFYKVFFKSFLLAYLWQKDLKWYQRKKNSIKFYNLSTPYAFFSKLLYAKYFYHIYSNTTCRKNRFFIYKHFFNTFKRVLFLKYRRKNTKCSKVINRKLHG